jgi:hypothetical protein
LEKIGLLFIGGLLASIPTLISTEMQGKAQLRQLVLDRQITALRDYSASYQKIATDVFTSLEIYEMKVNRFESEFRAKKTFPKDNWRQLHTDVQNLKSKYKAWIAEVNTQVIVVNILFNTNISQLPFSVKDSTTTDSTNSTIQEDILAIKSLISDMKKDFLELVNNHQLIINSEIS